MLQSHYYEDEDGVATEESIKVSRITSQKVLVVLLSIAGLGLSLTAAILGFSEPRHGDSSFKNWLQAASWVSIVLHRLS